MNVHNVWLSIFYNCNTRIHHIIIVFRPSRGTIGTSPVTVSLNYWSNGWHDPPPPPHCKHWLTYSSLKPSTVETLPIRSLTHTSWGNLSAVVCKKTWQLRDHLPRPGTSVSQFRLCIWSPKIMIMHIIIGHHSNSLWATAYDNSHHVYIKPHLYTTASECHTLDADNNDWTGIFHSWKFRGL